MAKRNVDTCKRMKSVVNVELFKTQKVQVKFNDEQLGMIYLCTTMRTLGNAI